ncbi:MAG: hypothetical protein HS115_17740 [Spirochaetales bacterium]|nr:hypothetical protein [Spirochaetales bacterium]
MEISAFLIRLIFLLLPGIICSQLYRKLKGSLARRDLDDYLEIIWFSLVSYLTYWALLAFAQSSGWTNREFTFFRSIFDEKQSPDLIEIAFASLIGLITAFIAAAFYSHKIINRLGRFLRVTKRYGDEDLWNYFMNWPKIDWVIVRDHKLGLIYFGAISVYSDSDKDREIILENVQVFSNKSGTYLYTVKAMYLPRNKDDLTIEIPVEETEKPVNLEAKETKNARRRKR